MLIVALLLYRYGVDTVTKQAPNLSLCQLLQSAPLLFLYSGLFRSVVFGFCFFGVFLPFTQKYETAARRRRRNDDRRFLRSRGRHEPPTLPNDDVTSRAAAPFNSLQPPHPRSPSVSTACEYSMRSAVAEGEVRQG